MERWGKTPQGKQRFRCRGCAVSSIRRRPDNRTRLWRQRFISWLTGNAPLTEYAQRYRMSVRTLCRRFQPYWSQPFIADEKDGGGVRIAVLDGTAVVPHSTTVLIAQDADRRMPIGWSFVVRERFESWYGFVKTLERRGVHPSVVVCDGQRGLLAAVRTIWPQTLVQRCMVHIHRQSRLWLTRNPKTPAGQELLRLINQLFAIRTRRQKRRWIRTFKRWQRRHWQFLKERSYNPDGSHWWYTHRKVRAVRSLLRNALPDLFRHVSDPTVPRTTNHVEGGVNSRLQELMRNHRGIRFHNRHVLASWYLIGRSKNQH